MFSVSGINLTTLIKRYSLNRKIFADNLCRLEAATSRLEDLALANTNDFRESRAAQRSSGTPSLPKDQTPQLTPQFNIGMFSPDRNSMAEEMIIEEEKPPIVVSYEKVIKDFVEPWVAKGQKIGQVVGEQVSSSLVQLVNVQATAVQHLFQVQLVFLHIVLKAQQPASPQVRYLTFV
jgi:hypothetical protein